MTSSDTARPAHLVGEQVHLRRGREQVDARVAAIYRRDGRWIYVLHASDRGDGFATPVTVSTTARDGRSRRMLSTGRGRRR